MAKHHYVYHSYEEWGREYIGCRTCDCLPEEDTKYFGSFRDKTFKPTGKTILFVCKTRQEAAEIEIELHDFFDVAVNPQFANRSKQTSTKFDTTGLQSGEKNPMYGRTGENHPMFGVPRTEEWKKAQSERMSGEKHPRFGVPVTEESKKKISEANSGKIRTGAQKQAMSGENHPMFGVPKTEAQKKAISEKMSGEKNPNYGNTGALHPRSKAIIAIEPDGTERHFGSGHEAARELEIDQRNLCRYLKFGHVLTQGKFKGWRFLYKNSENF